MASSSVLNSDVHDYHGDNAVIALITLFPSDFRVSAPFHPSRCSDWHLRAPLFHSVPNYDSTYGGELTQALLVLC